MIASVFSGTLPAGASASTPSCRMQNGQKARFAAITNVATNAARNGEDVDTALLNGGFCLKRMQSLPRVTPMHSVNTDVSVSKPTLLYDSVIHQVVMTAGYSWDSADSANSDISSSCCMVGNDGGDDSFAIAFSDSVHFVNYSMSYWGGNAVWSNTVVYSYQPDTKNNAGVGWMFQDKLANVTLRVGEDLNVWHGEIVAEVSALNVCVVDVFGSYTHTWSSTSVDGISISVPLSISISYSNKGSQWSSPGPSSNIYNLCTH